jgi:hypothetical protein
VGLLGRGKAEELERAYQRGLADGNAAAVGILVGCSKRIVVVESATVPDGEVELHVRDSSRLSVPNRYLELLMRR